MQDEGVKKKTKNKENNKEKPKKSRGVGRPTRVDYEKILASNNALLAAAEFKFNRLDRPAEDAARKAYDEAGANHRAALSEIGHQISQLEATVDRCEAEKIRLTAVLTTDRATSKVTEELTRAQYDRVLGGQRFDSDSVEIKYKATALHDVRRTALLDDIVTNTELKNSLKHYQRDGLYAVEQILISENVMINSDQEKNLRHFFQTIKNSKKCIDQKQILWNKIEGNKKRHEYILSRRKYYKIRDENNKYFHLHEFKKLDETSNLSKQCFQKICNELSKQIAIVQLKKNQITHEALNQKMLREECLKNVEASTILENNENYMIDLESPKKELKMAKKCRMQKLDYINKLYEEIVILIEKANEFIPIESKDNLTHMEWILNRGMVRHFDGRPEYIS